MIAFLGTANAVTVSTAPADWVAIDSPQTSGTDSAGFCYRKVATAGDAAGTGWTWTLSGNSWGVVGVIAYSGGDGATPISAADGNLQAGSATVTCPSITPLHDNCMIVGFVTGDAEAASGVTFSWSTGTEIFDLWDGSQGVSVSAADYLQGTAAAISLGGTAGESEAWQVFSVAIKPAAAGGTTYTQSTSGTLSMAGTVVKGTARGLASSVGASGTLAKLTSRLMPGSITLSPSLVRAPARGLSSSASLSSAVLAARSYARSVSSSLALAGTVARWPNKAIADSLAMNGALVRSVSKLLAGGLELSGGVTRRVSRLLSGALGLASSLGSVVSVAPELPSPAVKSLIVKTGGVMVVADTGRFGVVVDTGMFTLGVRVE